MPVNNTPPPVTALALTSKRYHALVRFLSPLTTRPHDVLSLATVALAAALVPWPMLTAPFDGSLESWGGAFYSTAAQNLLQYPLSQSWGSMIGHAGPPVSEPLAYVSHPPWCMWVIAIAQAFLGTTETAARAPFWIQSIAAATVAHVLLLRMGVSRWWSTSFILVAIGSPKWARYAAMADPQGSAPMLAMLAILTLAHRHAAAPSRASLRWLLATAVAGTLVDWPVVGVALGGAIWLLRRPSTRWTGAQLTAAVAASVTMLFVWMGCIDGPLYDAPPRLLRSPIEGFINRAGLKPMLLDDRGASISRAQLWSTVLEHHRVGLFWPITLATVPLCAVTCLRHPKLRSGLSLACIPLVVAAAYIAVFPQGAYTHDYWQFYLALGLILPTSIAAEALCPLRLRVPLTTIFLAGGVVLCIRAHLIVKAHAEAPERDHLRTLADAINTQIPPHLPQASTEPPSVVLEFYTRRPWMWNHTQEQSRDGFAIIEGPSRKAAPELSDESGASVSLAQGRLFDSGPR